MLPAYNALIRVLNSLLMWETDPNKYTTFMPAHARAYVCAFVLAGMPLYGKWLSEYLLIKVIVGWCESSTILAYWNGNLSYFCDASTLHYFQRSHACRSCWTRSVFTDRWAHKTSINTKPCTNISFFSHVNLINLHCHFFSPSHTSVCMMVFISWNGSLI